jgi:hypothetical protein
MVHEAGLGRLAVQDARICGPLRHEDADGVVPIGATPRRTPQGFAERVGGLILSVETWPTVALRNASPDNSVSVAAATAVATQ